MSAGHIRAELRVEDPGGCPVAAVSGESDGSATGVARSQRLENGQVVEEFTAVETPPSGTDAADRIFDTENGARYRFVRETSGCVCEIIEAEGTPVTDIRAEKGALIVDIHAASTEKLRDIVSSLRETYDNVSLESLSQQGNGDCAEFVLVDRERLTSRQREVVETALRMGYFDYPKGANAGEVADELGISRATFAEHLAAAESKLFGAALDA